MLYGVASELSRHCETRPRSLQTYETHRSRLRSSITRLCDLVCGLKRH